MLSSTLYHYEKSVEQLGFHLTDTGTKDRKDDIPRDLSRRNDRTRTTKDTTELAKKVCPRLGCVISPLRQQAESRDLGQTFLANSVHCLLAHASPLSVLPDRYSCNSGSAPKKHGTTQLKLQDIKQIPPKIPAPWHC